MSEDARASFAQFVAAAWPGVSDDPPPSNLMQIVITAAARFDQRPLYRASIETRAELRGHRLDQIIIDDWKLGG